MMAGSLPKRQERLVLAWAELHRDELLNNWERLQSGWAALAVAIQKPASPQRRAPSRAVELPALP